MGYVSDKGYGLLDSRLYVPQKWFETGYCQRRKNCHFPTDLTFGSKHQLATELLEKAEHASAFRARWVGVDSFFGSNHAFLDQVAKDYYYFAEVRSNTLVWKERPKVGIPPYKGRGPYPKGKKPLKEPVAVSEIAKEPTLSWKMVVIGEGSKGPITAQVARLRAIRAKGGPARQRMLAFY